MTLDQSETKKKAEAIPAPSFLSLPLSLSVSKHNCSLTHSALRNILLFCTTFSRHFTATKRKVKRGPALPSAADSVGDGFGKGIVPGGAGRHV